MFKMQFSSYKSSSDPLENDMYSNLQQERATAPRTVMLDNATSLIISGSYVDHLPSVFDLNSQNQMVSGYPVYSAVEGGSGSVCDLLADAHISTLPTYVNSDTFIPRDSRAIHEERFGEGTLVPATVLASLLASRSGCVHGNVNDPTLCGASNSRAFGYEDDLSSSLYRNYNNQAHCDMADTWVQMPSSHTSLYSSGIDSHTSGKGYHQEMDSVVNYPYGQAMFNNELSLSLATSHPYGQSSVHDHCSELNRSSITIHRHSGRSHEQSAEINDDSLTFASCRASKPLPTGSNYLRAIQEILADLSSFSLENVDFGSYSSCSPSNVASISGEYSERDGNESRAGTLSLQRQELDAKKKQLKAILKMLDEGYNQCLREIHNVMSSFRPITGLDPEVHVRFVLQKTSSVYKSLKDRISTQILSMKEHSPSDYTKEREFGFESSFIHKQWALQQLRRKEHQLWRPQRGLPERSVSVLRAWMFQNFLHPYPKDSEKHMLAIKSGLTRSQVSNWFINARVRLWKPMIEEMYVEINRRKAHRKGHMTENSVRGHLSMGN